jgi:exodeoxyribonuclease VII small subunit
MAKHTDIKDLPYEQAMKEIETIVGRLERGDVALEESINIFERGEALRMHCERLLKQVEARIEKVAFDGEGKPSGTTPLEVEASGMIERRTG